MNPPSVYFQRQVVQFLRSQFSVRLLASVLCLASSSSVIAQSDSFFDGTFDLSNLDGTDGFVLNGIDEFDQSGRSVSSAGDVNGDGFDDLIVGAAAAAQNGNISAGESYLVFGGAGLGTAGNVGAGGSFDLANLSGANGFVLKGTNTFDNSGGSVSTAGDINNDGFDDLIIGAALADPNGRTNAGESYLVFGGAGLGTAGNVGAGGSFDLANLSGTNGFALNGINAFDNSGRSVSAAGDVNGDGVDDLIIGASRDDLTINGGGEESYVVFGGVGLGTTGNLGAGGSFELANLNGPNGFSLNGIDLNDRSGFSVSAAGDVNGDGVDDLIIGAFLADPNGRTNAGESYVVFGGFGLGTAGNLGEGGGRSTLLV